MPFADFTLTVTYEAIGDHHLLVHFYHPKLVSQWILLDLADISSRIGMTYAEIIAKLCEEEQSNI